MLRSDGEVGKRKAVVFVGKPAHAGHRGAVGRDTSHSPHLEQKAIVGRPRVQHNSEKGEPAGMGVSGGSKRGSGAPKCTSYAAQVDKVGGCMSSKGRPMEVAYLKWYQPRKGRGSGGAKGRTRVASLAGDLGRGGTPCPTG